MLKLASWLIGVPLAAVAVLFAVSNRQPVALALWPLPDTVEAPAFLPVLTALALGLVTGGLFVWLGGLPGRVRARRARRRIDQLTRELDHLRPHPTAPGPAPAAPVSPPQETPSPS